MHTTIGPMDREEAQTTSMDEEESERKAAEPDPLALWEALRSLVPLSPRSCCLTVDHLFVLKDDGLKGVLMNPDAIIHRSDQRSATAPSGKRGASGSVSVQTIEAISAIRDVQAVFKDSPDVEGQFQKLC